MEVFVVEKPELPKVAVSLATRAGSVADPGAKAGVAINKALQARAVSALAGSRS